MVPMLNSPWGFASHSGFGYGLFTHSKGTSKYYFGNGTVLSGTNIPNYNVEAGTGNATIGVFAVGMNSGSTYGSPTSIYSYSSDTASAGTTLIGPFEVGAAAGNATIGVFALGGYTINNKQGTPKVNIYTYSSSSVSSGSNLISSLQDGAACGTSYKGVFAYGDGAGSYQYYNYSNQTNTNGNSYFTISSQHLGAVGNKNKAIFMIGYINNSTASNLTNELIYSSDTVSAGTNLTGTFYGYGSTGNAQEGIIHVANSGTGTSKYIYSSSTVSATSSIPGTGAGTSASPQGVNV